MASKKEEEPKRRGRPASTPEGREGQIVSKAVLLAEQQIEAGTASAQVITHWLKMGSERERLEREKLANENELLKAKVDELQSRERSDAKYDEALRVFKEYSGYDPDEDDWDEYVE